MQAKSLLACQAKMKMSQKKLIISTEFNWKKLGAFVSS